MSKYAKKQEAKMAAKKVNSEGRGRVGARWPPKKILKVSRIKFFGAKTQGKDAMYGLAN